jgi:predicted lactoylglutathione lyase
MAKELWINLPVKNVGKSSEFFTEIGFELNTEHCNNDQMVCFQVGNKKSSVLLFDENTFRSFTKNDLPDSRKSTQMLISFNAENRDEVDETARRVFEAGGTIFSEPMEIQGWMYGFGFADLDGHRWNMLHMDVNAMPKQ